MRRLLLLIVALGLLAGTVYSLGVAGLCMAGFVPRTCRVSGIWMMVIGFMGFGGIYILAFDFVAPWWEGQRK